VNEKMRKMNTNKNAFLVILVVLSAFVPANQNFYGGIAGTPDNPPAGTQIDANLTKYYGVPTATGDGKAYWFIGGWGWFNESEMMSLPSASLMYDLSPYACEAYGCGGGGGVPVPISPWVLVLFVISAVIVLIVKFKRIKK